MTRRHAATSVRDISASADNDKDRTIFFNNGTVDMMIELIKSSDKELQIIAMAALRHISPSKRIADDFSRSVLVKCFARCISWANDDMMCQIAGLLANLSEHRECHATMITQGVVPALGKLSIADIVEVKQVNPCFLVTALGICKQLILRLYPHLLTGLRTSFCQPVLKRGEADHHLPPGRTKDTHCLDQNEVRGLSAFCRHCYEILGICH